MKTRYEKFKGKVWPLRKDDDNSVTIHPSGDIIVSLRCYDTDSEYKLSEYYPVEMQRKNKMIRLTRVHARLLARRINQALEATK